MRTAVLAFFFSVKMMLVVAISLHCSVRNWTKVYLSRYMFKEYEKLVFSLKVRHFFDDKC